MPTENTIVAKVVVSRSCGVVNEKLVIILSAIDSAWFNEGDLKKIKLKDTSKKTILV